MRTTLVANHSCRPRHSGLSPGLFGDTTGPVRLLSPPSHQPKAAIYDLHKTSVSTVLNDRLTNTPHSHLNSYRGPED